MTANPMRPTKPAPADVCFITLVLLLKNGKKPPFDLGFGVFISASLLLSRSTTLTSLMSMPLVFSWSVIFLSFLSLVLF